MIPKYINIFESPKFMENRSVFIYLKVQSPSPEIGSREEI